MRIGVDIDGVLRDIHSSIFHYWYLKTGINVYIEEITDWDMAQFMHLERAGMTKGEFYTWWFNNSYIYRYSPDIENAYETIQHLGKLHDLFIVSSQLTQVAMEATIIWLGRKFPDCWQGIYFGKSKGIMNVDILIDDYCENLKATTAHGLLFNKPWNRDCNEFQRVYSWLEVDKLLGSVA